jgi:Tfp pilus assembly ATPase PilU
MEAGKGGKEIAYTLMNETQVAEFEETMEMNFAVPMHDVGRFRVNIFWQRGERWQASASSRGDAQYTIYC